MRIKTDGKDLLESQTFIILSLGATEIVLGDGAEQLRFILEFAEQPGQPTQIRWEPIDLTSVKVHLTNWNSPLTATLTNPVEIGVFRKRRLFVLFAIRKIGTLEQIREVTFSAYLGDEVQGG